MFDYGDVLFGGTFQTDLYKLDKIQVEAMRITTGATARSDIELLYEDTSWPKLSERRKGHVLILFYKIAHNLTPQYLSGMFQNLRGLPANYNLRSEGNIIRFPFARTEIFKRSFFSNVIHEWNLLCHETKCLASLIEFKQKVLPTRHKCLEILYCGERWASVHHARIRIGCSKLIFICVTICM